MMVGNPEVDRTSARSLASVSYGKRSGSARSPERWTPGGVHIIMWHMIMCISLSPL